jgi:nondiscriminating glutamyl-tRNA synthetase
MRVRFAPSPTGHLHVGNVRTALFNWLLARGQNGTFILRVEDTDVERSTAKSDATILEDLRWLGLDWDEGPDVGGPVGPYRSSERLDEYRARARTLIEEGRAYYCFCKPEQLEAERREALARNLPPKYSGRCARIDPPEARRRVQSGEPAAVRFRTPEDREVVFNDLVRGEIRFHSDVIGDQVLLRSDGHPAYNFAVVVDDGLMGVTHVVRGEDHISNTPRQLLIYEALGFAPPEFGHVAMVLGPDHTKLSKRHGAVSVDEFREKGYLPEALLNYLALLSWSPGESGRTGSAEHKAAQEIVPLAEMAKRFSLRDVGHSASVFDEEKLAWVNRHYLKEASPDRLAALAMPYLDRAGYTRGSVGGDGRAYLASLVPLYNASVDRLDQVLQRLKQLFEFSAEIALARADIRTEVESPAVRHVIDTLARELEQAPRLIDRQAFRSAADRVRQQTGQKGRALFHPIRIALTGAADGPELDLLVPAMERGANLNASTGIAPILGARERARRFADQLKRSEPAEPRERPEPIEPI